MKLSQFDQILSAKTSSASRQHRQDCRSCFGRPARRRRDSVYFDFFAFLCAVQMPGHSLWQQGSCLNCPVQFSDGARKLAAILALSKSRANKSQWRPQSPKAVISGDVIDSAAFCAACGAVTNDLAFLHDEGNAL